MMGSSPAAALELSEAEFALQLFIVARDTPARLDEVDEVFERRVFRQGGEPVFRRLRFARGPFDDQPFDCGRRGKCVVARRWPQTNRGEGARAGVPCRSRPWRAAAPRPAARPTASAARPRRRAGRAPRPAPRPRNAYPSSDIPWRQRSTLRRRRAPRTADSVDCDHPIRWVAITDSGDRDHGFHHA